MKLLPCITFASLILAGCTAPEGANPAPRCSASSECASGYVCYRGFCVVDRNADGPMSPDGTPAQGLPPEEPADAQVLAADAASVSEPAADASAGGGAPDTAGMPARDGGGELDAGAPTSSPVADASAPSPDDATAPASGPGACARETLTQRADAYLAAMASGDVASLRAHSAVRYTENGLVEELGQGVWRGRPRSVFARHAIDEASCSSVTQAVLQELFGRTVFGVRLRYVEEQLLEVEAQVVARNGQYFEPDAIIPSGADPWVAPVPADMRMSREALQRLAENYLASTQNAALLPAHATSCIRRQNGRPMDNRGSCSAIPGNQPFEELRYPVIDETAGIVTAIGLYNRFVGMYLFKAQDGLVQNIEVVGGVGSRSTGW